MSFGAASATSEPVTPVAQRYAHPLAWILLLGALVRVIVWFVWAPWTPLINEDARDYHSLATQLVTAGSYSNASGELISLRPPLYPAVVSAVYRLAGLEADAWVRALQALLSLLTTVLIYRLALLVYSQRVAILAALITCYYPALLAYANVLLSETSFTFLAIAFAWLFVEARHRGRAGLLLAAGVTVGLAALTRSIMMLFVPFAALYLLAVWPGALLRRFAAAAMFVGAFVVVIGPWAIRNTRVQHTPVIIDVMGGRNAMMGNYEFTPTERSWATISDVTGDKAWHRVLARERSADGAPETQGQFDKRALSHAMRFVLAHPLLTFKRDLVKLFNFWQLERTFAAAASQGYFGTATTRAVVMAMGVCNAAYASVMFAALFGICCAPPRDWRDHLFLVGSILFPCAIHMLIFAHERYRLPVMPLLFLYAAAAAIDWRTIWAARRTWRFRLAVALCLLLVAGWAREALVVDLRMLERIGG